MKKIQVYHLHYMLRMMNVESLCSVYYTLSRLLCHSYQGSCVAKGASFQTKSSVVISMEIQEMHNHFHHVTATHYKLTFTACYHIISTICIRQVRTTFATIHMCFNVVNIPNNSVIF